MPVQTSLPEDGTALRRATGEGLPVIDPNTATADELDTVPALKGRGFESVRDRGGRGRFTGLRQLDEVPGLSGKTEGVAGEVEIATS
jgi:DNA uptake protein ComE-like DNA-binding protein